MRRKIGVPPPTEFKSYSPSQLFKFFFQVGRWTEESFITDFQNFTHGVSVSTVTINKWKNHNVIPTRYSGQFFKLIEGLFEDEIGKCWITAFETVWATHSSQASTNLEKTQAEISSNVILKQHGDWIRWVYQSNLFGELFSPLDLYVPIQLVELKEGDLALYSDDDLVASINSKNNKTRKPSWTFVSGGSGSGKSMLAIHLAQELTKSGVTPIFLRGRFLSEIDIDVRDTSQRVIDSFSVKSFLQHFRASSNVSACIILDGLDEIADFSAQTVRQFIRKLHLELEVCKAHGKDLNFVIFGKPYSIEIARDPTFSNPTRHLEILGLDGSYAQRSGTKELRVGVDQRPNWWEKYLHATQTSQDFTIPDFLCADYASFSEFSSNPLFVFQICQAVFRNGFGPDIFAHEAVNAFTYSENVNSTYRDLLETICSRQISESNWDIDTSHLMLGLQQSALKNWQSGSLGNLSKDDESGRLLYGNSKTEKNTSLPGAIGSQEIDIQNHDYLFEIVREPFSLYLVSTLIIDHFIELTQSAASDYRFGKALENWAKISNSGSHIPQLADFCQNEARLRFESVDVAQSTSILPIVLGKLQLASSEEMGLAAFENIQRSARLLLFIWSCFNLERYKRDGVPYNLSASKSPYHISDLRRVQSPSSINLRKDSLLEPRLKTPSFISFSLSTTFVEDADLSQISFSPGHIQSFSCKKSSFALTHWSDVKITGSSFEKSAFQQAIFRGCRWSRTSLASCLFQGAKIQNSNFSKGQFTNIIFSQCHFADVDFLSMEFLGVIFDRCTFTNTNFESTNQRPVIDGVLFRHCTFMSMQTAIQKLSQKQMENCTIVSEIEMSILSGQLQKLDGQIREILQ